MRDSDSKVDTAAVQKKGGYPEMEQSQPSSDAKRKTERALGRKMRDQNKDPEDSGQPKV
jgi:hypothetical protein